MGGDGNNSGNDCDSSNGVVDSDQNEDYDNHISNVNFTRWLPFFIFLC